MFLVVQSLSHVWLFATPWSAARQASLSITNSQNLLKLMFIQSVMPSNHLILSRSFLLSNFPQHQGLFQWVSSLHQMTEVLEFQFQHQSFQWILRLISFRMDWLDLLAVQGTLNSLQYHSSKASILLSSAFFMVQLSHPFMTTGKNHGFDYVDFVGKVISLVFNMLSRFVISFIPRILVFFLGGGCSHCLQWFWNPRK